MGVGAVSDIQIDKGHIMLKVREPVGHIFPGDAIFICRRLGPEGEYPGGAAQMGIGPKLDLHWNNHFQHEFQKINWTYIGKPGVLPRIIELHLLFLELFLGNVEGEPH